MTEQISKIIENIKRTPVTSGIPVKIVAIDGHGGSGKSTLSEKLAAELGAEIVQIDDFSTWNDINGMTSRLITEVLEPIKHGTKTVSYERASWWPDHRPEPVVDKPVTSIIILEGCRSARKDFRSYLSYTIFVDAPLELCLQRGLARDGQHTKEMWLKWQADESGYIARDHPEQYANLVVPGF